jgi:hypothetical protein
MVEVQNRGILGILLFAIGGWFLFWLLSSLIVTKEPGPLHFGLALSLIGFMLVGVGLWYIVKFATSKQDGS